MRTRKVLGILLLVLCVSLVVQGRSYTLASAERNVGFFTNETGFEVTALVIVFNGNVEVLSVVGFGAEMTVTSSQGPTVVLHGVVPPSGVVIVEWALDGPSVGAAVWGGAESAKYPIDVKSPTAHMVIIPPAMNVAPISFGPQLLFGDVGLLPAREGFFILDDHQFLSIGSSDPDGTIVDYLWEWSDGVTAHGPTATRLFVPRLFEPYSITVTLTVTDDTGHTDSVNQTFTIGRTFRGVAI